MGRFSFEKKKTIGGETSHVRWGWWVGTVESSEKNKQHIEKYTSQLNPPLNPIETYSLETHMKGPH